MITESPETSSASKLLTIAPLHQVTITEITPSTVFTGTNPFTITSLSGTCFTTEGTVNKVQLDDGSGHTYNSTITGTVGNISINGTTFNLSTAVPGSYSVKVSKDDGSTWISSSSKSPDHLINSR